MRLPALPDRTFAIPVLGRGLTIWAAARAALALASWLMAGRAEPLTLAVTRGASAWVVLVAGVLGLLEIRRRNEHLLLANLGVSQPTLAALAGIPALIGELVIAVLTGNGAARS
ncbi:MAG: hypothetical protein ACM357_00095 [Gemmatimonadota bacterium]